MKEPGPGNPAFGGGDDNSGRPRGKAEGHNFSLQSVAETRQQAKTLLQRLNAVGEVAENEIFLPENYGERNPHANAHASVLTYLDELCKPTYLNRANAHDFHGEEFTKFTVPKDLVEENEVVVEVNDPRKSIDPRQADLELVQISSSLESLDWWWGQSITIKKNIDSPYWERESETERRKVVLPPRVLRATFKRLDALAAEFGVLLDIQQSRGKSNYE